MPKVNKTQQILKRLLNGDHLTVRQIIIEHSVNHPLTVIYELRKKGYTILDRQVANPTGRDYNEYWININAA